MTRVLKAYDLRRLVRETYAVQCILWQVGITADELFVLATLVPNAEPPGIYPIVQVRRGELKFTIPIGRGPIREADRQRYFDAWLQFAQNKPITRELDLITMQSWAWNRRVELCERLAARGFELRPVTN